MNSGGPPPLALPAVVSRRKQLAPAVAAASLVLGLGGLGFGLAANLRADSIEERLSTVEKSQQTAGVVEAASSPASTALSAENADAARTEIRTAFANVYTGVLPIEERLAYIDDPSGIGPVLSALSTGPAAPLALSSRVAVDRITFESANDTPSDTRSRYMARHPLLGVRDWRLAWTELGRSRVPLSVRISPASGLDAPEVVWSSLAGGASLTA